MPDRELTPAALQDWLREGRPLLLLDVRNAQDYAAQPQRIPGALKLDAETAPGWLPMLPPERLIVVYCQHGQRLSTLALEALRGDGFSACKLAGGMDAWRALDGELTALGR
jgi:rhodanese-related sulfurtransferase